MVIFNSYVKLPEGNQWIYGRGRIPWVHPSVAMETAVVPEAAAVRTTVTIHLQWNQAEVTPSSQPNSNIYIYTI